MFNLIQNAYAADASTAVAANQPHAASMTPMFVVLAVILMFYFWMWKQNSKKTQSQRQFLESLSKGDEVVTNGGIAGRVVQVENDYVTLQISKDTEIMLQKIAIASLLPKGTIKIFNA